MTEANHISIEARDSKRPARRQWPRVRLGELCHLVNGDAYKNSDWSTQGVPIVRIQNLNNHEKPFNHWAGGLNDRVVVKDGDVLLAWSGTPGTSFGAHRWLRGRAVLNQHIFRVDLNVKRLDPDWAVFAINEQLTEMIGRAHGAVGLRHVNRKEVESLEILLPPLPDQRLIAASLREQLAEVQKARAAVQSQLDAAQDLPAAYLHSAFGTPLTRQDTEDRALCAGWRWAALKELCLDISDGTHFTPTYVRAGVPFLSVKDITGSEISFANCRHITEDEHNRLCKRCRPEKGDVLYTKVGTTGIAKTVDTDRPFSIFVSLALLKVSQQVLPAFLELALNSPLGRKQAQELTQGMANRNLVLNDIKKIRIPLPPIRQQETLISQLRKELLQVQELQNLIKTRFTAIDHLPASLMREAFAGRI